MDSKIFVDELLSAYVRYASSLNLASDLLEHSSGHAILKITGKNAAKAFQYESGKHCCQRIPVTESNGRVHTSMISVAILPIKQNGCQQLRDSEIEIITQRGHGKGGQHQNTTDSAVRIKHIPTGLSVFINGRDQYSNKKEALKILTAKVNQQKEEQINKSYSDLRTSQMGKGSRGDKIRTYNFAVGFCKDHILCTKTNDLKGIMKGKFELIIYGKRI